MPPCSTLATSVPPGARTLGGEGQRRFRQRDDAQVIGGRVAGGGRRHVAEHHVGRPGQRLAERRRRPGVKEIVAHNDGARHRVHFGDVDGHHPAAAALAGRGTLDRHLGPAARRGAQVDHASAAGQEMEAVVELDELEGGARAITQAPRLGDVGVVELTLQPAGGGDLAPLGRLHALARPPCAGLRRRPAAVPAHACRTWIASSAIMPDSRPSRMPRSATRTPFTGHRRQTASRTAQPTTTRSALWGPMQEWSTRLA